MKKRGGGEDCGSWMDTYGDMVTLLLCFFVMLYSMSTIDQDKLKIFIRSIYPTSSEESVGINQPDGEDGVSGEIKMDPEDITPEELEEIEALAIEQLYEQLVEALNEKGVEGVTVSGGEGYTYVAFQNKTFFNGNSYELTEQGQEVLGVFCDVINPLSDQISLINIMAHTAQERTDIQNEAKLDRELSAMRAAQVSTFIQERNVIEPEKLVGLSYGQFRPVAPNDSSEGRAKNRRVELLLVNEGADERSLNAYYEEYSSGANADRTTVTTGKPGETGTPAQDGEGFAPMEGTVAPEEGVSMQTPMSAPAGE
ncbi:MAG: flagellar motor protein MotB [Lachnospiraceae bacterium]|jgi:chemotaxis protein MotB|nr:flagellar motor protein MotB [Lachnospiraceae bacterium]